MPSYSSREKSRRSSSRELSSKRHRPKSSGHSHSRYRENTFSTKSPPSLETIITQIDQQPPMVQMLIREVLLEQKKRQMIEEKCHCTEREYKTLMEKYDQTVKDLFLFTLNYDQCRLDLENHLVQLRKTREENYQLRTQIDHLLNKERQSTLINEEVFIAVRQRTY